MSISGGSVVGTALVLVVPESKDFDAKVQTDVRSALAKIDGNVVVTADTKQAKAGVEELSASVKQLGATVEEQAAASVAASVKEREETQLLAAEYQKVAAAAVAGSEEQIAASKLAADAQRKLGVETAAVSEETKGAGGAFDFLTGKLRGVGDQNNLVAKSFGEVENSGTGAASAIESLGPAGIAAGAGILAIAGAAAAGISKLEEMADKTRTLQITTGATADDASKFSFVLHEVGIDSDDVSGSLFRLNRNIQDHADKFEAAGVAIAHYQDGTTNVLGTLDNVRQKLGTMSDATEKNTLLFNLLGRGALSLADYLKLSNDQVAEFNKLAEETGHVLNQQTVDQVRTFQFALSELGARASDLEVSLGRKALPAVIGFLDVLNAGVSVIDKATNAVGGLGDSHEKTSKQSTANKLAHDAFSGVLGALPGGLGSAIEGLTSLGNAHDKQAAKAQAAKDKLIEEAGAAAGLGPFMDALSADEANAGLSGDKLTAAAAKLKDQLDATGVSVGLTGEQLLAFGGGDATQAEAGAKKVTAAMDAASSAFQSAFSLVDTFSLSNLTSQDKSAETATNNLAKAEQALADLRATQSAKTTLTISDQIAMRKAVDAVTTAQKDLNDTTTVSNALLSQQAPVLDKAKAALQALLPDAGKLTDTQKQIANFYSDSLIQAQTFSDNLNKAIEQGYDPGLIADIIAKGPKEAAPLLDAIVSDQTGHLKDLVNNAQGALNEQGLLARETARITNLAINDSSDQRNKDFETSMAILQQEAKTGGTGTATEISNALGIMPSEVKRIADEMGIKLADGITAGTDTSKTKVNELQFTVNGLQGKTVTIDVDTGQAQSKIDDLRSQLDSLNNQISNTQTGAGPGGGLGAARNAVQDQIDASSPAPSDSGSSDPSSDTSSGGAREHEGGILHFFAGGGREIHQAFVARAGTPTRVFNEPETGGEGYIPLAQSKRPRSEAILSDIAHTFGGAYVKGGAQSYDIGGWTPSTSTVNTSTSTGIVLNGPLVAITGRVGMQPEEISAAVQAGLTQAVSSGQLGQAAESHRMSYR